MHAQNFNFPPSSQNRFSAPIYVFLEENFQTKFFFPNRLKLRGRGNCLLCPPCYDATDNGSMDSCVQ